MKKESDVPQILFHFVLFSAFPQYWFISISKNQLKMKSVNE